jgi:hypothetical protein
MPRQTWVDLAGYLASLLVFCTFYMKTMIPLRAVAIGSNVVFMTYGLAGHIYPVAVLHAVLLPLNVLRLQQMRLLIRRVREASRGHMADDWLIPLMSHEKFPAGHVLFRAGDPANSMYLILSGTVRLAELGVTIEAGHLIGEMGIFAPENRRTATAICQTDIELGAIGDQKVLQLYYQNPEFGFSLLRLIIQRLLENESLRETRDRG